jgi:hypothetical protein
MLSVREREKVGFTFFFPSSTDNSLLFFSTFENSVVQVSDQGLRKVLYQKVSQYRLLSIVLLVIKSISRLLLPSLKAGCLLARFHETVRMTIL